MKKRVRIFWIRKYNIMNFEDISGALNRINSGNEKIILELGCGNSKLFTNSIAIDIVNLPGVDIVCDLNIGLGFIPDNSVDEIYSSHFLEHLNDPGNMLCEVMRILKPGGKKEFKVPHFSNPYFYSDYTHHNHFGIYSMSYFSSSKYFKRQVPNFYNDIDFEIENVYIKFKSNFKLHNFFNRLVEKIVNSHRSIKELYEAHFCYTIPAYELVFTIRKRNV